MDDDEDAADSGDDGEAIGGGVRGVSRKSVEWASRQQRLIDAAAREPKAAIKILKPPNPLSPGASTPEVPRYVTSYAETPLSGESRCSDWVPRSRSDRGDWDHPTTTTTTSAATTASGRELLGVIRNTRHNLVPLPPAVVEVDSSDSQDAWRPMNGRDLESSELGLPGENVETPIAIRAPRVKNDVWLAAAAAVQPRTHTLIAAKAIGPRPPTRSPSTTRL